MAAGEDDEDEANEDPGEEEIQGKAKTKIGSEVTVPKASYSSALKAANSAHGREDEEDDDEDGVIFHTDEALRRIEDSKLRPQGDEEEDEDGMDQGAAGGETA